MNITVKGSVAYLNGDLVLSKITSNNIDSLSNSLQQIESERVMNIRIDCSGILSADISGLQLLDVWIQCARFRGIEFELINLSNDLQLMMRKIMARQGGIGHSGHSTTGDGSSAPAVPGNSPPYSYPYPRPLTTREESHHV